MGKKEKKKKWIYDEMDVRHEWPTFLYSHCLYIKLKKKKTKKKSASFNINEFLILWKKEKRKKKKEKNLWRNGRPAGLLS